jgi:hypothetical protein
MADREWSILARVQDEIAKTEDLRQKERDNYHKMLYKYEWL